VIAALLLIMVVSIVPVVGHATSSPSFTAPSNLKMGSFVADPEVVGGNATNLAKWFSMSWGINQAYQVGATDYPYQFLFGDFYQNGQQVVQPVQVEFTINWTEVRANEAVVNDGSYTSLGAPHSSTSAGAFGTGIVNGLFTPRAFMSSSYRTPRSLNSM